MRGSSRRSIQRDSTRPATSPSASGPPVPRRERRQLRLEALDIGYGRLVGVVQPRPHPGVRVPHVRMRERLGGNALEHGQAALAARQRECHEQTLVALRGVHQQARLCILARRAPAAHRPRGELCGRGAREQQARGRAPYELVALGRLGRIAQQRLQRLEGARAAIDAADIRGVQDQRHAEREHAARPREHPLDGRSALGRDLGRVRAARRRRDADAQVGLGAAGQREPAQRRLAARGVRVEEQDHVAGERAQLAQLLHGERRPHRGHDVLVPRLVEAEHVGVALDDDRLLGTRDRRAGQVQAVERLALVQERALGRVHVLRAGLVGRQAAAECDRAAARGRRAGRSGAPRKRSTRARAAARQAMPGLLELAVGESAATAPPARACRPSGAKPTPVALGQVGR